MRKIAEKTTRTFTQLYNQTYQSNLKPKINNKNTQNIGLQIFRMINSSMTTFFD